MRFTPLLLVLGSWFLGSASLAQAQAPAAAESASPAPAASATAQAPALQLPGRAGETPRLFAVGTKGTTLLRGALALSNGEFLLAGAAEDLSWAGAAPRTPLGLPSSASSLPGAGGTTTPFLLHVSADFETVKAVYTLPAGALSEVTRLRSTEVPGQPTGAIVISGRFAGLIGPSDAYWLARLDGNGVDKPIRQLEWFHIVKAPGDPAGKKSAARPGDYAVRQPWDLRSDGQVIYAEGEPFATSWAALRVLSADGKPGTLPAWRHQDADGSAIVLKAGNKGSLRSTTAEDFEFRQPDEQGNPGRKGRYPDDYYFVSHEVGHGPGYTGYRVGQNSTQRVSQLAIDRRDNTLAFGTSTQSRLPDGNPDFEPAFVVLNADGSLRWWARGYREVERRAGATGGQDGINSPPDQYVDHAAIDYANNRVVFAARCHGNGVINFWSRQGFQPGFSGRNSNIHISWLGGYSLADGGLKNATFVAEMAETVESSQQMVWGDGPLIGWPPPSGLDLNTTYIRGLDLDAYTRPLVMGIGRRPYTSADALIPNFRPSEGVSHWAHFARIYSADFKMIAYSTLLRGLWDPKTGASAGDAFEASSVLALQNGMLALVAHNAAPDGKVSQMPWRNAPAWGQARLVAGVNSAIVALTAMPAPIVAPIIDNNAGAAKRRR
jgi:hypothetical protein